MALAAHVLIGLLGVLPSQTAGERPALLPDAPAVVRVVRGRVGLVDDPDRVLWLSARTEPAAVTGWGYIELGLRAEVEISWRGRASLRVHGPAALEWEPRPDGRGRPVVRVAHFGRIELENRRGALTLDLPQGWVVEAGRAALHLRELSRGELELRHHGGEAVRVRSGVPRKPGSWPKSLHSGSWAVLGVAGIDR